MDTPTAPTADPATAREPGRARPSAAGRARTSERRRAQTSQRRDAGTSQPRQGRSPEPAPAAHPVWMAPPEGSTAETAAADPAALAADHRTDHRLAADFPVLAEVPELGEALAAAQAVDRLVARLISCLLDLTEHDLAESATGVAIDQWLALVAGRTHADRRMLLTTCDVLRRLPTLRSAFIDHGTVTWAQVRAVVLRVVRLPHRLDDVADQAIGDAILGSSRHSDPDDLVHAVSIAVSSLEAGADTPSPTLREPQEFLALQPRLDGQGGRVFGEYGAVNFATLDAALAPDRRDLDTATDHDDPSDHADDHRPHGHGSDPDSDDGDRVRSRPGRWDHASVGRARAQRLLDLLAGADHADSDGRADGRAAGRPQVLVRVDLGTLLDRDQLPADLLTTLTGGHVWADAATIRRLIDERGADLRTVVLDDTGAVLGVGRRTRVAPDWLADAILARHTTCAHPTCGTSARSSDLDHADPWWPLDDGPGGATDQANLAPVCARHNRSKEREGWRVTQHPDGRRRWHHPRTGLTADTRPETLPPATRAAWNAAGRAAATSGSDPPGDGPDPPG